MDAAVVAARPNDAVDQMTVREYDAKIDTKKRITLRGSMFEYYHVVEFPNGKIELQPRELTVPFEISKNTLHMLDLSAENFKKGIVSEPLDLSAYEFIEKMEVEDDDEPSDLEAAETEIDNKKV